MKRIYLSVLGLTLCYISFAQGTNVQFGLKGGVNISNFNDEAKAFDSRTGFHAGGLAHIHLTRNWAIQPEVVYSTQGAETRTEVSNLSYVNIPVLAQYMIKGLRIETGPQIGLLTKAEVENKTTGIETNYKDELKATDVSWSFGIGYMTSSGLGIDARYNLGLTDITETNTTENKNRVWQFGIFYQFRR